MLFGGESRSVMKLSHSLTLTKVAMCISDLFSSRRWCCFLMLSISLLTSSPLLARILLDDVMSQSEKKKTGVDGLSYQQRLALEQWLNDTFNLKNPSEDAEKKVEANPVYLSQNIDNGRVLELSDRSVWQVAPQDVYKSSFWIVPFPLEFIDNDDPVDKAIYPKKIVNKNTNVSVKVRMLQPPAHP